MFFFSPHSVCLVPVVIICIELEKGSCNLLIYQIKININNEYIMPAASEKSFFPILLENSHTWKKQE